MTYHIFLDDERYPAYETDREVVVCRDFDAFKRTILERGFPEEIHLDHDLGPISPDGSACMKWLVEYVEVYCFFFSPPEPIRFYIHSQNPIGARRMMGYIRDIEKLIC